MSIDASFEKAKGSRYSHEMRQSGMPGIGILIYPSLWNYTANRDLAVRSISWFTLAIDSTSILCRDYTMEFMILTWSMSAKFKVPKNKNEASLTDAHNEMNYTKKNRIG